MKAKSALKIDEFAVVSAKKYVKQNRHSVSRLTEKTPVEKKFSPLIESLIGVISEKELNRLIREDPKAKWIARKS
jgi:hypothetical protein